MLSELVQTLKAEQIKELAKYGVPPPRISEWRSGARRPTLPQAKVLARVTGADFQKLVDELADLEATPEQRSFFRQVSTAAIAILSVLFLFTLPSESRAAARLADGSTPSNTHSMRYT